MGRLVLVDSREQVVVLTLNRPERHNSLVPELLQELLAALDAIRSQPGVRTVVLQANGRSFSTGGDMRGFYEHLDALESYAATLVGLLNRVILALVDLPLPVVAAVHGIVTGGSLGLVLGSDVVLVAPEAGFTPYYSVVGFSPDGGWTAMLPSLIGPKRVANLLAQNGTMSAEEAVRWGLAEHLVPAQQIQEEALSKALQIAAGKPGSLCHAKGLLSSALGDLSAKLEAERSRFVEQIATEEARQGIVAFVGKTAAHTQVHG